MVKKVSGYVALDGTFFETAAACELYEAEEALRQASEGINIQPDKLVEIIRQLLSETERYVKAIRANKSDQDKEHKPAPVQQQQT